MAHHDENDRRIAEKERELAKVQTEETLPHEIEYNIVRESMESSLRTLTVVAKVFAEAISDEHQPGQK